MAKLEMEEVFHSLRREIVQEQKRPSFHKLQNLVKGFNEEETELLYGELIRILLSVGLKELPFPLAVFSPTADIVAFNTYFRVLYALDVTDPEFTRLKKGVLGPNVLRLYFDETYKTKEFFGGYERWREHTKRNIKAFQIISREFTNTSRYQQVVRTLWKLYPEFREIWDEIEREKAAPDGIPVQPLVTIYHPDLKGEPLTFAKFEIPQEYLGTHLHVFAHVPDSKSLASYTELVARVAENKLDDFINQSSYFNKPSELLLLIASSNEERYDTIVKEGDTSIFVDDEGATNQPTEGKYPQWMVERARWLVEKVGGTFEQAISVILRDEAAWKNRTHADPDTPVRAIATGIASQLHKKKPQDGDL